MQNTNQLQELRQNIKILKTLHVWGFALKKNQGREKNSPYGTNTKKKKFPLNIHWPEL
jgi:hypothetical protein